jgi:ABC-type antimicrobial peptide transport system permease subunit
VGRDFTPHDDASSPRVAIVNMAFAQRVMRTDDPVGKRFRNGLDGPLVEVVGVVEDGKYDSLTQSHAPALFWPILQQYNGTTTVEVKSSLPAAQIIDEMKQGVARLDAELPLYGTGSLDQMLGYAFLPTYAATIALGAFGVLAVMLAITGVHGLVSYAVAGRVHEIGIRIAVGARTSQIVRLVLGRTALLLAIGSAIGLVLALAAGNVLASVVYQSSASDPQVLATVLAAIALLGLLSTWAPTRRALRIDPMVALRYE